MTHVPAEAYLVDGTFELFRGFFAAPAATAHGAPVGAVRGVVRSLAAWLRRGEVQLIGVAFDTVIESFRNQLFAGYKTGAGIEPELWAQFPLVERAVGLLGCRVWGMIDFEADDALATAAHTLAADPTITRVVIASPDKDLCQMVRGQRVVSWDRMRDKWLDDAGVREKFGVGPAAIADWLALVGDDADGVPGLAKWGAKSAAAVLSRYPHIEDIPDDEGQWDVKVRGAAAMAAVLRQERAQALLYRQLTTLCTDAPIPCDRAAVAWTPPTDAAVLELADLLGLEPAQVDPRPRG